MTSEIATAAEDHSTNSLTKIEPSQEEAVAPSPAHEAQPAPHETAKSTLRTTLKSSPRKNAQPLHNSGRNPDGTMRPGNSFRFKPGQSGNPKGRPKNVRYLSERLRAKMLRRCPGDPHGRTFADMMIDELASDAAHGHPRAVRQVFDRLEGPTKRVIDEDGSNNRSNSTEVWTRLASQLMAECDHSPEAKRLIIKALEKMSLQEE